jgi:hypothetical protein
MAGSLRGRPHNRLDKSQVTSLTSGGPATRACNLADALNCAFDHSCTTASERVNLVCASYFYNRKKLNNGSDRQYLFREGQPTEQFFWTHGELTVQQAALLRAHSKLETSDWYFNRAIFNVMVAIDDELKQANAVRSRDYWLGSARKRMQTWRKMTGGDPQTFRRRGLVRYPDAPDVFLMLSLAEAPGDKWDKIYGDLLKLTQWNERVYERFLDAGSKSERTKILREAEATNRATAPLLDVMKKNAQRL